MVHESSESWEAGIHPAEYLTILVGLFERGGSMWERHVRLAVIVA